MKSGLYEQVVNNLIRKELDERDEKEYSLSNMEKNSAPKVLSRYIESVVRNALERKKNLPEQIECANRIISEIAEADDSVLDNIIHSGNKTLLEVKDPHSPMKSLNEDRPMTTLSSSYLFTGSSGFSLGTELKREIVTSDEIDMIISFVKISGLSVIRDALRLFSARGGKLRLICTTYMGATEAEAVREIALLPGAEVKVSYDTKHTRLHAKSYVFKRYSGFSTAYVGSSNLSHAAITDGREWNMKITSHDQSDVFSSMCSVFDTYWNSDEYETFKEEDYLKLKSAIASERGRSDSSSSSFIPDIRPYPFQEAILDKIQAERKLFGINRNLVVAATGTGKTVISAFDYKRWCQERKGERNTLLFIAHREEILRQSLDCYRTVLRDRTFGSLYVGGEKPEQLNYLFASIQTIGKEDNIKAFSPDHFDYIVVDEFHHAASMQYKMLLSYFKPQILLGLTATPERMDKKALPFFSDNRITAEIRLPEAIDRELLVPFHYYGVRDTVDLDTLRWTRGGYEEKDLENVYVLSQEGARKRADMIISSILLYVGNPEDIKCIGFCVSVKHAEFMASFFSSKGLKAISVTGSSGRDERASAKDRLLNGEVNFIFTVDLFNEGVDIPEIDTIMLLRPTQSLTVFLQQLGRGLRTCTVKEFLTVLDFIGQSNAKYSFSEKFRSLLSGGQRNLEDEIKNGFVSVPSGCYIQLEKDVERIVLANISAILGKKSGIVENIRTFQDETGKELTLASFLDHYSLRPEDIYRYGSFSSLKRAAGKMEAFTISTLLESAMLRLSQIDSSSWLSFLLKLLKEEEWDYSNLEKSMLDMLLYTVCVGKETLSIEELLRQIKENEVYRRELMELFSYKLSRVDFIPESLSDTALEVFAHYSRNQILASFGYSNPGSMQEGVKYFSEQNTDVLFVTLDKSEKKFSPSTMYKDYAISPEYFHWESQNSTSPETPVGKRYISGSSRVLLFVRERKEDQWGTMPYTFLGPVTYSSHKGSKPMAIVWKMEYRIPARFIGDLTRGVAI